MVFVKSHSAAVFLLSRQFEPAIDRTTGEYIFPDAAWPSFEEYRVLSRKLGLIRDEALGRLSSRPDHAVRR